jgi:hypothetical protein
MSSGTVATVQYSPDIVAANVEFWQGQVDAIAEAMKQAKARNDTLDLERLTPLYLKLNGDIDAYYRGVIAADTPGPTAGLVIRLVDHVAQVTDDLVAAGVDAVKGVAKLPAATANLANNLPVILFLVAVLAVLYLWWEAKKVGA